MTVSVRGIDRVPSLDGGGGRLQSDTEDLVIDVPEVSIPPRGRVERRYRCRLGGNNRLGWQQLVYGSRKLNRC